jgi:hypothetical protein
MDRASSLVSMSIRYAANSIRLIKVIQISDLMLILGQGLLVIAFFCPCFFTIQVGRP